MCRSPTVLAPPTSSCTSKLPFSPAPCAKLTALIRSLLSSPALGPPVINRSLKSPAPTSSVMLSIPLLMRASRPASVKPPVTRASAEASSKVTLASPVKFGRPPNAMLSRVSPVPAPRVIVMPSLASTPPIATESIFKV